MEITDNIIIYEANEFPHFLMQPFYSDYVGIVIYHQGMFRFCVDGTSFVASMGETVFSLPESYFMCRKSLQTSDTRCFLSCGTDSPHAGKYRSQHAALFYALSPVVHGDSYGI